MMNLKIIYSAVITAAFVSSCSHSNQWTVTGNIDGANNSTIYVESASDNGWATLDSVTTDTYGHFSYSHEAAALPDIYRLRLGDKSIYFPIDSIETITVETNVSNFDRDFTLLGSPDAEMLTRIDRRINRLIDRDDITPDSVTALKRDLTDIWLSNRNSIVGYYMINKMINGVPVFNPAERFDLRVIGGVATAFKEQRPNDPRSAYLERIFISNRRNITTVQADTIVADEISFFDINLYDKNGTSRSLIDVAKDNNVVILCFTAYDEEFSPAFNVLLNNIYNRFNKSSFEIFQISVDNDEFFWRETAKNLPWVTVRAAGSNSAEILTRYNVRSLPTVFIIRNGELFERVTDLSKLEAAVARNF